MKKAIAWILCLALTVSAAVACAEPAETIFETLAGLEWTFSSGAGAWSTDLRILPDGSFSGEFHDSEMGESAEDYPYGTVYCCSFTGKMAMTEQADEYAWRIRVETLRADESQEKEAIDGGIRYVAAEPYGLSAGDEMLLYRPGTPISALSEEMLLWAHVLDRENPPSELDTWFLSSEKNFSGFVGYPAENDLSLANPWEEMTQGQLLEASGLSFGVPEDAENIVYRFLRSERLAEMRFTLGEDEFCARIQPTALREGELMNIADMYFEWQNEEAVSIGRCYGTIGQAQTGSEDWAELCLWYDIVPGLMYSLSVCTTDPDGLDLTAVAGQVYLPAQGEN